MASDPQVYSITALEWAGDWENQALFVDASNGYIEQESAAVAAAAQQAAQTPQYAQAAAGHAQDAAQYAALSGASIQGTLQSANIGEVAVVVPDGQAKKIAYATPQSRFAETTGAAQSIQIDQTDVHHLVIDQPVVTASFQTFSPGSLADTDTCRLVISNRYLDESISSYMATGSVLDISPGYSDPLALSVNSSGTRLYVLDRLTRLIWQYNVEEGADLSTAIAGPTSPVLNSPYGLQRYESGSKVLIYDAFPGAIHEYDEATPGEISSIIFRHAHSVGFTNTPATMALSPDGRRIILATIQGFVYETSLQTPGSVVGASVPAQMGDLSPIVGDPLSISFNRDGTKFYALGRGTTANTLAEFNCPNPGTISGWQYTGNSLTLPFHTSAFCFSANFEHLFWLNAASDEIFEYRTQVGALIFQPPLTGSDVPVPTVGQKSVIEALTRDRGVTIETLTARKG
jgi:hypothetical protein